MGRRNRKSFKSSCSWMDEGCAVNWTIQVITTARVERTTKGVEMEGRTGREGSFWGRRLGASSVGKSF